MFVSPSAIFKEQFHKLIFDFKQHKTGKWFVVFLTENGKVEIPKGKKVVTVYKTDDLFIEKNEATDEVTIRLNALIPAGKDCLEKGFIIEFESLNKSD